MNNNTNQDLIKLLYGCQNKPIRISLKNTFHYDTSDLKVINDSMVIFTDRKGEEVMVAISEISMITKLKGDKYGN